MHDQTQSMGFCLDPSDWYWRIMGYQWVLSVPTLYFENLLINSQTIWTVFTSVGLSIKYELEG